MDRNREILFELAEDENALLAANGGSPFSRKGVISACASHLSDKGSDGVTDHFRSANDEQLVQAIRCNELDTYDQNPNRITSDCNNEHETVHDYGGRFVWELLQNADDAMGKERSSDVLIGSKGLGFKAVLEITDEPEIHSGPFHFRFSAGRTQRLLKEKGLHSNPPRLTFRIPHGHEPSRKIQELLDEGYATVVRLPFRDGKAREAAVDRLRSLDSLFLLLAQELSCVRVRTPEGETIHEITRREPGLSNGDVKLSTRGPDGSQLTSWRRWVRSEPPPTDNGKQLSVAICLPLTERGDAIPHSANVPFHVFFPTEEAIGTRTLIHASLDLEHNRKRVREGEYDDDILHAFSELFQDVLVNISARTALGAFGEIASDDGDSPLKRLQKDIRSTLSETSFVPIIGGGRVRPGEVQLWQDSLGFVLRDDANEVREARLLTPDLRDTESVLKSFDAQNVENEGYIRLLGHCRNDSLKECLKSWLVLARHGLKRFPASWKEEERQESLKCLRKVPCWWTETGAARALDGTRPLLFARPEDWPDWLPADCLHPRMRTAVKRWEKRSEGREEGGGVFNIWKELISKSLLRKRSDFLQYALLPFLDRWDGERWEADGWRVLRQVLPWSSSRQFETVSPWIGGTDDQRAQAARTLRLPTDKGWLPAADCYAGEAWDGPPKFDLLFASVEDRGILLPFQRWLNPTQQGTHRDQWKAMLRWAGVSWEPKVRRVNNPPWNHRLIQDYEKDLHLQSPRWQRNWVIEHFPECMQDNDAKPADVIRTILSLAEAVRRHKAAYFHYKEKHCDNFANFQLRHEKWLPCKPALLHDGVRAAPRDAFLPGKGLGGLLPEADKDGIENKEWYRHIQDELTQMDVRAQLPDDPTGWHEWMRRLSKLAERDSNGEEDMRKAADALYRRYLKLDNDHTGFPEDIAVPSLSWRNDRETLTFSPPCDVFHVDQPHFDEVRQKILQREYKLFLVRLKAGEEAPERLSTRPLSKVLQAEPRHETRDEQKSKKLLKRYHERRLGLNLAAKLNSPLPENLTLIAVRGLRLELTASDGHVADAEVLSWRTTEDDSLLINLDKDKWRALGHGLAERIACKEDKASLFENLLRETDKEVYLDRLRHEGVTEDDLMNAESKWHHEPDSEQVANQNTTFEERGEKSDEPPPKESDSPGLGEIEGQGSKVHEPGDGRWPQEQDGSRGSLHVEREGGGTQRPRPETGFRAEDWFEERLEKAFPDRVTRHDRDDENRESDFVISGDPKLHIEVKRAESRPGTFYWSGNEYEKARGLEGKIDKYVMAILFPDGEQGYEIRWIWRPLDELRKASRDVQWVGNSDYKRVETDSWDVTERPDKVPTKRYVFRIKLDDKIIEEFERDTETLEALRNKINNLQRNTSPVSCGGGLSRESRD